jgi:CelD/BcsL family acetyltransferase involved in cellulose biosynthesis
MTDAWSTQRVPLTFRIGEIPLFSVTLHVDVQNTDWPPACVSAGPAAGRDGFLIRSMPVDGPLPPLGRYRNTLRYAASQYERYFVDLAGTMEGYLGKFSGKSRSTLKRKIRKFAKASGGETQWRTYKTPAEIKEFHALARRVSEKTYQERLLDAGLPAGQDYTDAMAARAARDAVRGYILFLEGDPVAYLYCPARDRVLLYQYLGYDPAHANLSPGTVLQCLALEALFAEGDFALFDFTEGEGAHKEFFATGSRPCADVFYLKPSIRNRLAAGSHYALDTGSAMAVRLLTRLGVKSTIKKFVRRLSLSARS